MTDKPQKKDTRPVKCPYCEEQLPRGEAIRHTNGRYYHEDCYEEWRNKADTRGMLIEYIMELYGLDRPTGMILQQIKRYHEDPELSYTYKGMELTLRYYYEILGNNPRDGDGVGIIPIKYEEATEQYIQQMKINESIENLNNSEQKIIYVSPSKKTRKKNLIDMELL